MSALPKPLGGPDKRTPVFNGHMLPTGLRSEVDANAGACGVISAIAGQVRYHLFDPISENAILDPDRPGSALSDQPHLAEPLGALRMRVEVCDATPELPGW